MTGAMCWAVTATSQGKEGRVDRGEGGGEAKRRLTTHGLAGDGELLKVGIALPFDTESVTIGLVLPLQLAVHEAGDEDTGQQED
jgi:hypothetical protein